MNVNFKLRNNQIFLFRQNTHDIIELIILIPIKRHTHLERVEQTLFFKEKAQSNSNKFSMLRENFYVDFTAAGFVRQKRHVGFVINGSLRGKTMNKPHDYLSF